MKKNYYIFLFFLPAFLFYSSVLYSQVDNPRIDHLSQEMIQSYFPEEIEADVITISGFDNYFLGVDFAEPHMSVNPNDPLQYFNAFNINEAHRTYDGHDWTYSSPSFGTSVQGDPVTAYDSLGNLYYMQMTGNITNAKVIRSTNNGQTWTAGAIAVSGADKCWMAADQTSGPFANYVYATMTNTSFTGQNFARSTNQGATFTQTFSANSSSPLPGAMVAVGANVNGGDVPGGCVYFVTDEGNSFGPTYRLFRSTDGGATFTLMSTNNFAGYVGSYVNNRNSVQNMRTRPYPFIAADNSYGPFRGRLYLVYASNTPSGNGNKPDIFCRYSTDQGSSWSSPVVVNDDPSTTSNNQWHPSIWCDKETGRFFVKWMDTRDTPTSDSAYIYASYSDDGGLTFAPNQRISNVKMKINCSTCGGGGTPRYQGDYDAISSKGDISMIVWTDFRNGSFGSYTGYFPDFALTAYPPSNTVGNTDDQTNYTVNIPAVKLYDQEAQFMADVTPAPATGSFSVDFTPGTISTFPDSVTMTVHTVGTVPNGTYTVNVQGAGPNGIPVHRRSVTLEVIDNVPVELTSFTANVNHNSVILSWQTATEINNSGFEIQRCFQTENVRTSWDKIGFVQGNGTTTSINQYSFIDKNIVKQGHYIYRLKQIDLDGKYAYSAEAGADVSKPNVYYLSQNYPNPFNPTTNIEFSIPERSHVTLKVYDVLGNEVATLVDGWMESTNHQVTFDGSKLASGIYYYTLMAGNFTSTKKLILLK